MKLCHNCRVVGCGTLWGTLQKPEVAQQCTLESHASPHPQGLHVPQSTHARTARCGRVWHARWQAHWVLFVRHAVRNHASPNPL